MEELAPAKINLSLRVIGQREDGFREIETVMAPITLHDVLEFSHAKTFQFRCNDPTLPPGEENLVVRAARAFFAQTQLEPRVSITLEKRIPYGAGLGGGSSDAAATLRGLNKLFAGDLSSGDLSALAARIGSDVAFFLCQGPAICRGRGELIEPIDTGKSLPILLLKPSFPVSTAWAYSRFAAAREIAGSDYSPQIFEGRTFVIDLDRPVFEKFVFLARLKQWLLQQPETAVALLSGSGSTLLTVLHEANSAKNLRTRARQQLDPNLWVYSGETLAHSERNRSRP
jgi:4-diphosphocytidyl-2-C-methyl-D-erythritol kinase